MRPEVNMSFVQNVMSLATKMAETSHVEESTSFD